MLENFEKFIDIVTNMANWVNINKQWVFGGIGITVLSWLINILFEDSFTIRFSRSDRRWLMILRRIILTVLIAIVLISSFWLKIIIPLNESKRSEIINEVIGEQQTIQYKKAVEYIKKGKYAEATGLLDGLNYNDSNQLICDIMNVNHLPLTLELEPGDHFLFGLYEQDGDIENGSESIEWIVLDKTENRILAVSRFALDCKPFNEVENNVTWKTSSLRIWLNNDFFNNAFNDNERGIISETKIRDEMVETSDNIFLLSRDEVDRYFVSKKTRRCLPTAYAIKNGAIINANYKYGDTTGNWWLRSDDGSSVIVSFDGNFSHVIDNFRFAVRPTLWLNM